MKKTSLLSLLFIVPLLVGCGNKKQPQGDVSVSAVYLNINSVDMYTNRTYQLTANVQPSNATNKEVLWSSSNPYVATVDELGLVTASDLGGTTTITAKTIDGEFEATCDFNITKYWTLDEESFMKNNLYGYALPFVSGATVEWSNRYQAVIMEGPEVNEAALHAYGDLIEQDGFAKQVVSQNVFRYVKEVLVDNNYRNLQIDLCAVTLGTHTTIDTGNGLLQAIVCDPYEYSWPTTKINEVLETFEGEATSTIPVYEAEKYKASIISGSVKGLRIECFDPKSTTSYGDTLIANSYTRTGTDFDDYSIYISQDGLIEIRAKTNTNGHLEILINQTPMWPSKSVNFVVQTITNNSGTTVPELSGALKYEYSEAALEDYGYYSVMCTVNSDPTDSYKAKLIEEGYTVFSNLNFAANYFAVSSNNDLLVQFKYDNNGKSQFDIFFQKINGWDATFVSSKVSSISSETTTTIPQYPGYGFDSTYDTTKKELTICIKSAENTSITTYASTLTSAGWTVSNASSTSFSAVSSDRKISMTADILTSLRWVRLVVSGNYDQFDYASWPTTQVNELLTALDITSTLPECENVEGFSIVNGDKKQIVAYATATTRENLMNSYGSKLQNEGFIKHNDGQFTYYINEDYLAVVLTLDSSVNQCFIITLSKWNDELPSAEDESEWPTDFLINNLGATIAAGIPAATGTLFETSGQGDDVTIKITGGDMNAYKAALSSAGFTLGSMGVYEKNIGGADVFVELKNIGNGVYTINIYYY